MSDAVTISLIGAALSLATAILGAVVTLLTIRMKATVDKAKTVINKAAEAIVTLEKNTNSIKDDLVRLTGESERAIGKLEGRAELHEENKAKQATEEEGAG